MPESCFWSGLGQRTPARFTLGVVHLNRWLAYIKKERRIWYKSSALEYKKERQSKEGVWTQWQKFMKWFSGAVLKIKKSKGNNVVSQTSWDGHSSLCCFSLLDQCGTVVILSPKNSIATLLHCLATKLNVISTCIVCLSENFHLMMRRWELFFI